MAGIETLDVLLGEAGRKLASATRGAGAKHLRDLPLVYLLGEAHPGRTTTVVRTDWNAELLAGETLREGEVLPTEPLNVWYANGVLVAEPGAKLAEQDPQLKRLFKKTQPGSWRNSLGKAAPWRAAVVAVNVERLLASADQLRAAATQLGDQLRELSRLLGLAVPVYVLFTKADRIPYFAAWTRHLSSEEAAAPLGAALPDLGAGKGATWGEGASTAILETLDSFFLSLENTRLPLLAREGEPATAGECYEFPREMRKMRTAISTFLQELARPNQLHASPLLRGFFFTGVRAVVVEQAVAAPRQELTPALDPGATQVFSAAYQAPQQAPARTAARKTAQWAFLPRFYARVAEDAAALGSRGLTRRASLLQRSLYAAVGVLALLLLIAFTTSFFRNRALVDRVAQASSALRAHEAVSMGGTTPASLPDLQSLDALRTQLAQLELWQRKGAPLSYRWGLYQGGSLLAPAREIYFQHFRTLLLAPTQAHLVASFAALPATPAPDADYNGTYSALRAYLITTSHAEKSTADFLAPVLTGAWPNGATLSPEQRTLAERQFAFYADELPRANPYSIEPEMAAVSHARTYLSGFGGFERIYQSMLNAASRQAPSINFNAQYQHSADWVVEPHTVPGAFTPAGYTFMQNALAHPDVYFRGETWVLGDQAPPTIDPGPLKQQLVTRYAADYLATWRAFLRDAQVVRARNLADAGTRLAALSGNNSPLLALVYTASSNTAVADKTIAAAFQAPQTLVLPTSHDQYIGTGNKSYIDALLALRGALQQVSANPAAANDPAAAAPIASAASAAHLAAQQTAQGFHIDAQGHVDSATLALMEAPITSVDALVHGLGPAAASAGAKSFCSAFNAVWSKAPFRENSPVQATPAELTALLQPGSGQLWQFYNANLKTLLVQQGADYGVVPNPPMQVNAAFLHYFNRMAQLSSLLFPSGASGPTLTFALRPEPSKGVRSAVLKMDAQTLSLGDGAKQFTWQGSSAASASLTANDLPLAFTGPWAIFQLLQKAHAQRGSAPDSYVVIFPVELANTPVRAPDGTPVVVDYELSGPGAAVLAPGALSGLRCVDTVGR